MSKYTKEKAAVAKQVQVFLLLSPWPVRPGVFFNYPRGHKHTATHSDQTNRTSQNMQPRRMSRTLITPLSKDGK